MAEQHLELGHIRTDGGTQPRAQLDIEIIREYAADMLCGARFPPVTVFYDGTDYWLADGFHRLSAARMAQHYRIAADVRQGSLDDAKWFSYSVNQAHGMRRTNEDKRRAVEAALAHPYAAKYPNRELAQHCGVSAMTVGRYRKDIYNNVIDGDQREVTRAGSTYTMQTEKIGHRPKQESSPQQTYAFEIQQPAIEPPAQVDRHMAVHYSSETPEHYTPKEIIDAALECMGFIDLDPCSNSHESPNVPARRHYTVEDDGLSQKWQGFVYMNPPYGREIGDWVNKLCEEHETGLVPEAIALLPARPDTQWWKRLRDYPVCFVEGRLTFIGNDDPAPFPSAIFGLGIEIDRFFYAFSHLGDIWQRMEIGMFGQ